MVSGNIFNPFLVQPTVNTPPIPPLLSPNRVMRESSEERFSRFLLSHFHIYAVLALKHDCQNHDRPLHLESKRVNKC